MEARYVVVVVNVSVGIFITSLICSFAQPVDGSWWNVGGTMSNGSVDLCTVLAPLCVPLALFDIFFLHSLYPAQFSSPS